MKPFIVLWHIPSEALNIVGSEDGNLGIVADGMMQYCVGLRSKTLKRVMTAQGTDFKIPIYAPLTMVSWVKDMPACPPDDDIENIPIQKYIVADRWVVRCGYGPRTKTWVLRSSEPIDIQDRPDIVL